MSKSCDVCFSPDDVRPQPAQEGLWEFTCLNVAGHPSGQPHQWFDFNEPVEQHSITGGSLEPYSDALMASFEVGGPWLEFPVIEWRFRARAKRLFDELVANGGHVLLKPNDSKQRTASIVLVQALGHLRNRGQLVGMHAIATAPWLKQKSVTYWALPPEPLKVNALTWARYAELNGIASSDLEPGPTTTSDVTS